MGLSSIAAIVLLFDVGLETDLKLLLKYSFSGGVVALGGVVFSFVLGDLTLVFLSDRILGVSHGFMSPQCLFAGVVATATSVGITARILSEKKKIDTAEGVTILSAAVIDDVIGIILLAVVLGMVSAGSISSGATNWSHIAIVSGKAIGVWLIGTVLGIVASRRIGNLLKLFRDPESITVLALGFALVLAGLFEEAGLAMIIGAYVMGLSLSRTDIVHLIREKLHIIYAFLVPVFFSVTGMQINPATFGSRTVLYFGLVYTVISAVAKVAGCGIPALLSGFNLKGALRIGIGMMPRGEVGLIVAGVGLAAGFLDQGVFASIILMVVANTIIAPPILVKLFANHASGRREQGTSSPDETQIAFSFPSGIMASFFVEKLCAVFRGEEFFVHRLGHEDYIYQVRKDYSVINFTRSGTGITFHCSGEETSLVKTAMEEALAGVEKALVELREPIDTKAFRKAEENGKSTVSKGFRIAGYIHSDLVKAHMKGTTKLEIIEELLNLLVKNGQVSDREAALQAILDRENSMSTGMEHGIAIPHGKTDSVHSLVCAVGLKKHGIDFQALDGKPSKIFILILSPLDKPAPHLQFMAAISRSFDENKRLRILACRNHKELYSILSEH